MTTARQARGLDASVESQRREQITRAVMACIAEDGLERTTMRNVAQRAGVSTGTLAYYFRSKKDLVDASLLEASRQYMERFNRRDQPAGPAALDTLVDTFLAPGNADAGFVLQMIEVGLHNSELRGTHLEMVEAGRTMIENCLTSGVATGRYRDDIDPKLAAALLHGVLIWWGSELLWNATSRDLATNVSRLMLRLMETGPRPADYRDETRDSFSTADHMRAVLMADPALTRDKARKLADAIETMYDVAREAPKT